MATIAVAERHRVDAPTLGGRGQDFGGARLWHVVNEAVDEAREQRRVDTEVDELDSPAADDYADVPLAGVGVGHANVDPPLGRLGQHVVRLVERVFGVGEHAVCHTSETTRDGINPSPGRPSFIYTAVEPLLMTFVVPFDGSARTKTALGRARELAAGVGESVVAFTAIPANNAAYARKMGWVASDEPFDVGTIAPTLRSQVHDIAPDATFEYGRCSREATANGIAKPIRKFAKRTDASTVVVGSDSAGRFVTTASSVGGRITSDGGYDVLIVRSR